MWSCYVACLCVTCWMAVTVAASFHVLVVESCRVKRLLRCNIISYVCCYFNVNDAWLTPIEHFSSIMLLYYTSEVRVNIRPNFLVKNMYINIR